MPHARVPGRPLTADESAGMDFDMGERSLPATTVGMGLDGKAPGRPGREPHLDRFVRREPLLDVVAVQVEGERLVRRPTERDLVALSDANDPLLHRKFAAANRKLENL